MKLKRKCEVRQTLEEEGKFISQRNESKSVPSVLLYTMLNIMPISKSSAQKCCKQGSSKLPGGKPPKSLTKSERTGKSNQRA